MKEQMKDSAQTEFIHISYWNKSTLLEKKHKIGAQT